MTDWGEVKARLLEEVRELERESDTQGTQDPESVEFAADIRAALERVDELCDDLAALRGENARLRARVEEFGNKPLRCCAMTIPPGCRSCACADAAEAKLARCVEALDRVLTEAGMQAHKHGCPERMRRPARWDEFAPCAGCQAEAVLAAAKGGE